MIELAVVRALVPGPHLQADLDGLLELLETLGDRREPDAEAARLFLVPARADPQPRPAAGQHVQGGDGLGQDARVPVDGPGDERAEPGARRVRGQEAQRGVRLQHFVLGRPDRADLEEVVHDHDVREAGVVRGAGHGGQGGAELFGTSRPGEIGNLKSDLHTITSGSSLSHPEAAPLSGLPCAQRLGGVSRWAADRRHQRPPRAGGRGSPHPGPRPRRSRPGRSPRRREPGPRPA